MTCIVGLKFSGHVYIGGDSAGVSGWSISSRKDPRVFINGEMSIGFTTSFRFGQILQYELTVPKHYPDVTVDQYMVKQFVPAVRQALKEHGYLYVKENNESGGCCLIGYRGRLFLMDSDFQIGEMGADYYAVGCGADIALGALHAIGQLDIALGPEKAIKLALGAAETYSAGVKGPYTVASTAYQLTNSSARVTK